MKPTWPTPKKPYRFVKKDEYWVFRLCAWFLHTFRILDRTVFYERFWTTFGHVIGVRTTIDISKPGWQGGHEGTIKHELIHIWQKERLGAILQAILVVGPAPTVFLPLAVAGGLASIWIDYPHWIVGWIPVVLMILSLPLSIGFAWGRFYIERQAYMVQIWEAGEKRRADVIHWIVKSLHENYARTWPKEWMRKWFFAECDRRGWPY